MPNNMEVEMICPYCFDDGSISVSVGKAFRCSNCPYECKCPDCGETHLLLFIQNEEKQYFICGKCSIHFGWKEDGIIYKKHYKKNNNNKCCCDYCGSNWRFIKNDDYWDCNCGAVMIPNDGMFEKLKGYQKQKQQSMGSKKKKSKTYQLSSKDYQEYVLYKKNKTDWEQFKIFLNNKEDINAAMTSLVETFRTTQEEAELHGFDLEELEKSVQDLDEYLSQVFIKSEKELWKQYEHDNKEIESWNYSNYYDDDDDDTLLYDNAPFVATKVNSKYHYNIKNIKEIYSEVTIEDDYNNFNKYELPTI